MHAGVSVLLYMRHRVRLVAAYETWCVECSVRETDGVCERFGV